MMVWMEPTVFLRSACTELSRLQGQVLVVMSAPGEGVGTGRECWISDILQMVLCHKDKWEGAL